MNEDLDPEQRLQEVEQTLPQEPTAIGAEARAARLPRQLLAFRHRNYQLFFGGQIISLTGMWLQQVALGWLVLQLTNSALLLGIVGSISALPVLLFSLPAGLIIERFSKRNLLVLTQTSAMVFALILAGLTYWHLVNIYYVIGLGFLLGLVNAFDAPTRQSFVIEMVGRDDLANAITMNSAMFNSAKIVGPAVAGVVIGLVGTAGAFFLNGISFIAVIIGLLLMRITYVVPRTHASGLRGLKEGLLFIRENRTVSTLLQLTAVVSIFSMSYVVLMPIVAKNILKVGPSGLGYLMSATGVGALAGAVTLSSLGDFKGKGKLLIAGNLCFCSMLMLFTFSQTWLLSLTLLMIAGWGIIVNMALTNTLIQTATPDSLRGRVMSVYTLMFMGMAPIGSLQAGAMAHWLGTFWAIRIGVVVCALVAIALSPRIIKA